MKIVECKIPEEEVWIVPIGDVHIGDKSFNKGARKKLQSYIDWVGSNPNARVFLNGDIFNVASRCSKTSPFETNTNEYMEALDIFAPIKKQIIGANEGNHEHRLIDMFGISPTQYLCRELEIPYTKWSCVVKLQAGRRRGRTNDNRWCQTYWLYFHHTSGGAGTIGNGVNKVTKLQDIVQGVDVYFGSHNHQKAAGEATVFTPSMQKNEMVERKVFYIDCGSFMSYVDNYAEQKMYRPTSMGTPIVKFSGLREKHDISIIIGGL